jgi:Mor family transcriptional regulator
MDITERKSMKGKSPIGTYDDSDPGDEMQLRVRYQHSYGLILLAQAVRKKNDCFALWFEQHDDILYESSNKSFDYYQVKTRKETSGYWTMGDVDLTKSLKRFTEFEQRFGASSRKYVFVSNCPFKETNPSAKDNLVGNSPINFFREIVSVKSIKDISNVFKSKFSELAKNFNCDENILFKVIKKTELVKGPTLDAFEVELSCSHLHQIPECRDYDLPRIHKLRDEIIYRIFAASSLSVNSPEKHIFDLVRKSPDDPRIISKKMTTSEFLDLLTSDKKSTFSFMPGTASISMGCGEKNMWILKQKLKKAGLENQYESIRRKSLSTEYDFLEQIAKSEDSSTVTATLDQVESIVLGECCESILEATESKGINGVVAMTNTIKKLRHIVKEQPDLVRDQPYESLIGIAGLLTGECKIWWSPRFELEVEK